MLFQLQKTLIACLLLSWAVPGSDIDWSAKLRKFKHKTKTRERKLEGNFLLLPPPFPRSRTYIFACTSLTGHRYYLRAWNRLRLSMRILLHLYYYKSAFLDGIKLHALVCELQVPEWKGLGPTKPQWGAIWPYIGPHREVPPKRVPFSGLSRGWPIFYGSLQGWIQI